jgi:hypothetical protein
MLSISALSAYVSYSFAPRLARLMKARLVALLQLAVLHERIARLMQAQRLVYDAVSHAV